MRNTVHEILERLIDCLDANTPCVYCAIAATWGSTPQKAGAIMIVFPDGSQVGTLGGGCVEAEVKQRALLAMSANARPEVMTLFLDDIQGWDDGLICGGRMSFLVYPIDQGSSQIQRDYFRTLLGLVDQGSGFIEAIVLEESYGLTKADCYLLGLAREPLAALAQEADWETVRAVLAGLPAITRPTIHQGIALLPTLPRIKLLIVGGGHIGQAVGKLATEVGFELCVLDDRQQFANAGLFPDARQLIVGDIGATLKELGPTFSNHTYALIVTRGHKHDQEALHHLIQSASGYIGMIGSKRKVRLIFDALESQGVSPEMLRRVRAPVGLDIGSQTVPEIAISIVAELIAYRNLGTNSPRGSIP